MHVHLEFWKINNIQYNLVSKSIFNVLSEYTLKKYPLKIYNDSSKY